MAFTITHKLSTIDAVVPSTANLALGEIAVNSHNGKLFIKTDDNAGTVTIKEISSTDLTALEARVKALEDGVVYEEGATITGTLILS